MKATVQALMRWGSFATALGPMWATAQGQWQSLDGGVVEGSVSCFTPHPDGGNLLAGGSFRWMGSDSLLVNKIASWNGEQWGVDHTGGGDGGTGAFGEDNWNPVSTLVYLGDTLYASFSTQHWQNDPDIAYGAYLTEDTVWHPLPSRPDGFVFFLPANGRLFMGGNAMNLDSVPFPGVCDFGDGQFAALPGIPFDSGANIWAVEYWNERYYFGGITYGELGSRNIVSYDGVDQWSPLATGIGGNFVRSIRGYGDSLYVGGFFLPGNNVQSSHIQIWDGYAWHPFFPEAVEFIDQVKQMEVYEDALWILGSFQFSPDGPDYSVLRFDGHQLCAIGGPAYQTGSGSAMAFFQGYLYKSMGPEYPGLEFEHIARLPLEGLVPDECIDVTTGIAAHAGSVHPISVFPDPASDHVTITGWPNGREGIIDVLDLSGRKVIRSSRVNTPSFVIDIVALPVGCYSLRITSAADVVSQRFVKQ